MIETDLPVADLKGETAREVFDPDSLMRGAERDLGLSDWGDTLFQDGLEILCRSFREDRERSATTVAIFGAEVRRLLAIRLQLAEARKVHPEIPRQKIVKPIILVGLPRSGTTILHSLLAADPDLRSPLKWELDRPFPPPRAETFTTDPRIALAEEAVAKLDPQYRAMHQIGAQLPLECNTVQDASFRTLDFSALLYLPTYHKWIVSEADMAPAYAFHTQFLQHLQAFTHKDRWVLKGPPHIFWLNHLLRSYPDACLVVTHRDPGQIIPSGSSFITHIRSLLEPANPKEVGHEQRIWSTGVRRMMQFRDAWHKPEQFFDVQYSDFISDPMAVVHSIYRHFNLPLTADKEAAMQAFMAENKQEKHGKHIYNAADFGLDPDEVRRDYREYIERFNIPVKR